MVRIPQHLPDHSLLDIPVLLPLLCDSFHVDRWIINIYGCIGTNALKIESMTENGLEISHDEFIKLYSGITQTIDGAFKVFDRLQLVAEMEVFDSSFWEIKADTGFENLLQEKFGQFNV